MTDHDGLPGGWVRELHASVDRVEGDLLSPGELKLVERFVAGELDEIDAEYVTDRAAAEWSWDRAISAALMASPATDDDAPEASTRAEPTASVAGPRDYELRFGPIATLAAADLVKATVRWEAGTLRLLQSPMRADLAIELLIDDDRAAEFADSVFFFHPGGGTSSPIALLANGSPVFSRLYADHFAGGLTTKIECVPVGSLTPDQTDCLRRSRRNLRDPGNLAVFDRWIARAEGRE